MKLIWFLMMQTKMQPLTRLIDQPIFQSRWFFQDVAHGMAIQTAARECTRIVMHIVQSSGIALPTPMTLAVRQDKLYAMHATQEQSGREAAEDAGQRQHVGQHLHLLLHWRTFRAMGGFGNAALIEALAQQIRQVMLPMVGWIPFQSTS